MQYCTRLTGIQKITSRLLKTLNRGQWTQPVWYSANYHNYIFNIFQTLYVCLRSTLIQRKLATWPCLLAKILLLNKYCGQDIANKTLGEPNYIKIWRYLNQYYLNVIRIIYLKLIFKKQFVDDGIKILKGTNPGIDSYSAFWDNKKYSCTELIDILKEKNITDVFICGIAYDFCVGKKSKKIFYLHSLQ